MNYAMAAAAALLVALGTWCGSFSAHGDRHLEALGQTIGGKQFYEDDVMSIRVAGDPDPVGWVWCPNGTEDGNGTEYWFLTAAFPFPGGPNSLVTFDFEVTSLTGADATAVINAIVTNYAHVTSSADLTTHKHVVTLGL